MDNTRLFNHLADAHDLILLQGEMEAIWMIVQEEIDKGRGLDFPNAPAGMTIGKDKVQCLGRTYIFSGGDMANGAICLTPEAYEAPALSTPSKSN